MKTLLAIALFATPVLVSIAVFTHHMPLWNSGFWAVVMLVVYTARKWTAVVGGE